MGVKNHVSWSEEEEKEKKEVKWEEDERRQV